MDAQLKRTGNNLTATLLHNFLNSIVSVNVQTGQSGTFLSVLEKAGRKALKRDCPAQTRTYGQVNYDAS